MNTLAPLASNYRDTPLEAVALCPLVFVYGTLKRNHGNHRILNDGRAEFLGVVATFQPHRLFVSGLPYLVEGTRENPGKKQVIGELFKVDTPTMERLDRLEGHPSFYERRLSEFVYADRRAPDGNRLKAWVYFHPWSPAFRGLTPQSEY